MRHVLPILLVAGGLLCALAPAATAAEKWEFVDRFDGVRVWRMQRANSNVFAFRGEVLAKVHIGRVLSAFATSKYHRGWVDRWEASTDLKLIGPLERVFWIRFDLPWPVSDRDYVLHTKAVPDAAKRVVRTRLRSVAHPRKPEATGCCVRGRAFGTHYRFEALPGGWTKLMVEVHTDPKGVLPAWLVNVIQKKWPSKTLNGLVARAKKSDIGIRAGFEDWHPPYGK